jgi:hypothetical protein
MAEASVQPPVLVCKNKRYKTRRFFVQMKSAGESEKPRFFANAPAKITIKISIVIFAIIHYKIKRQRRLSWAAIRPLNLSARLKPRA